MTESTHQINEDHKNAEIEEGVNPNVAKMWDAMEGFFKKPAHESAYAIIREVARGNIDYEWFKQEIGDSMNSFPLCDYMGKHPELFTPEKCKDYLNRAKTPEEFRNSEIFQAMIADDEVQRRYQIVAREWHVKDEGSSEDIHTAMVQMNRELDEYRDQRQEAGWTRDIETKAVSGWRAWIKRILS